MKLADIKEGMKLKAVGDYGDCIRPGDEFVVYKHPELNGLHISCRGAGGEQPPGSCHHDLDSTVTDDGDLPELELNVVGAGQ